MCPFIFKIQSNNEFKYPDINPHKISEINLFLPQSHLKIKVIPLNEHWLERVSIIIISVYQVFM